MITFSPGESKIARIPLTVSPAGLNSAVELYLGPDEQSKTVSSGLVSFTSTGQEQMVSLNVIMPTQEGIYHVYIDTYAGGVYLAGYISEDIEIGVEEAPLFTFGPVSGRYYRCPLGGSTWNTLDFYCTISNNGAVAATHRISLWWTYPGTYNHERAISGLIPFDLRLEPGESYNFRLIGPEHGPSDGCNPILAPNRSFSFWLQDELGNRSGVL